MDDIMFELQEEIEEFLIEIEKFNKLCLMYPESEYNSGRLDAIATIKTFFGKVLGKYVKTE